jgi:hypothetical protein
MCGLVSSLEKKKNLNPFSLKTVGATLFRFVWLCLASQIKPRDSDGQALLGIRQGNMACTTGDTKRDMVMLS